MNTYKTEIDEYRNFLKNTYQNWTTKEKAKYHCSILAFGDRMQGGFQSTYKHPAVTYFSLWFIDNFGMYNKDCLKTLELISSELEINLSSKLKEMITLHFESKEWQTIADELGLLNK